MTSGIPGMSKNDLLQSLTADLSGLVRQEFQRMQQELVSPLRGNRAGARMLGGSAVLASMATGSATALVIRLLDRRLPPPVSAAVAAAVFGAGASALAQAGRARMRQAWVPPGTTA